MRLNGSKKDDPRPTLVVDVLRAPDEGQPWEHTQGVHTRQPIVIKIWLTPYDWSAHPVSLATPWTPPPLSNVSVHTDPEVHVIEEDDMITSGLPPATPPPQGFMAAGLHGPPTLQEVNSRVRERRVEGPRTPPAMRWQRR